jgi:hypothetical protein
MIKWNINRFCLQIIASTELALVCVCHFGFQVRYINILEKNNHFYHTIDDLYQEDKLTENPRLHFCCY